MSESATLQNEASRMRQNDSGNSSPIKGLLIFAALLLPMLAAYFIFKTGIGMPTTTVNKGDLLLPATSVVDLQLQDSNGKTVLPFIEPLQWRMIIAVDGECDKQCLRQLYVSRQVHIRLGEKAVRVERWLVNGGTPLSPRLKDHLQQEHPRLRVYQMDAGQWRHIFSDSSIAGHSANGHHIYYVDQQGYAMMSYNPTHQGADLLADIKRLLKYSYEE